jgi:hypothetical protein
MNGVEEASGSQLPQHHVPEAVESIYACALFEVHSTTTRTKYNPESFRKLWVRPAVLNRRYIPITSSFRCTRVKRVSIFLVTWSEMWTYWSDVNFAASTVRVSHKPDRNWHRRHAKKVEIPVPAKTGEETEGIEGEG